MKVPFRREKESPNPKSTQSFLFLFFHLIEAIAQRGEGFIQNCTASWPVSAEASALTPSLKPSLSVLLTQWGRIGRVRREEASSGPRGMELPVVTFWSSAIQ